MGRVLDPLQQMGLEVEGGRDRLPLTVRGIGEPHPDRVRAAGAVGAGQERRAAGRPARRRRDDRHRGGGDARSHRAHAAPLRRRGDRRREPTARRASPSRATPSCTAATSSCPADPSSAAFLAAALHRAGLGYHHRGRARQSDAHRLLRDAAGDGGRRGLHRRCARKAASRWPTSACATRLLLACTLPPQRAPSMIDEYPMLAVVAAFADGETRMDGLAELKVKESDRLAATVAGLTANGVIAQRRRRHAHRAWCTRGSRRRHGRDAPRPPHRHGLPDHGSRRREPVTVDDTSMIATSFPEFISLMQSVGARFSHTPGHAR